MIQTRDGPVQRERLAIWLPPGVRVAGAILALVILLAYANTFAVPMLLDDHDAITAVFSDGHRGWWTTALFPSETAGTGGRPLLSLTFALNYAWTGEAVWSYHLVNLAIHVLAALVLFGTIRRTLLLPALGGRFASTATEVGFVAAALWALHPVQTESVTYISQRAESLTGFFYLLTLYGFVQSTGTVDSGRWKVISIAACCCGMLTKEVMVTVPVAVLLFDRAFFSGSWRETLVRRLGYYAGLAAGWLVLALCMITSHLSRRGIGYGGGVGWFDYARAETKAVVHYAKLAFWPHPLVFDYGAEWIPHDVGVVWPYALAIVIALAATAWLWSKSRPLGFCAAAYFLLLAPTSSVVPIIGQPLAENRVYLPLGALVALTVPVACQRFGRRALAGFAALALMLAVLTIARNQTYRSATGIWEDTLAKHPFNSRAHHNLGIELAQIPSRASEAVAQYEEALRINPRIGKAHLNLGTELAKIPARAAEALPHFEAAVRLMPRSAIVHNNLAVQLAQLPGRLPEALAHYEEALRLRPDYAEAHNNYANDLVRLPGRVPEALLHYQAALASRPDFVAAEINLANALAQLPGRRPEAVAHYEAALRIEPDNAGALIGWSLAMMTSGHADAAIAHCQAALARHPGLPGVRKCLGDALAFAGRLPEAAAVYQDILRTPPIDPEIYYNLGVVDQQQGRIEEAVSDYENTLVLNSRHSGALNNLGVIWADRGDQTKATKYFEAALAVNPGLEGARSRLQQFRQKK